ncbi:hypothetical protein OBBRIDRAFT_805947 [Obba rivulosa]|uniref:Uncharacterized protein n=1 Tax=Obba rivulosa TaxID=1052685 RepID=A0A8E2AN79_9APHY|nr:hypothetical protein OBBRIDRAFT_805947 [Obba rivulosa]
MQSMHILMLLKTLRCTSHTDTPDPYADFADYGNQMQDSNQVSPIPTVHLGKVEEEDEGYVMGEAFAQCGPVEFGHQKSQCRSMLVALSSSVYADAGMPSFDQILISHDELPIQNCAIKLEKELAKKKPTKKLVFSDNLLNWLWLCPMFKSYPALITGHIAANVQVTLKNLTIVLLGISKSLCIFAIATLAMLVYSSVANQYDFKPVPDPRTPVSLYLSILLKYYTLAIPIRSFNGSTGTLAEE